MTGIFRPAARCIIVNQEEKIFLVNDGSTWALPGGGADFGETLVDAVRRESLEELGITAQPERLVCVMDRTREKKGVPTHLLVFLWSVTNSSDFIHVENTYKTASHAFESEEVKYFSVENLPENLVPDGIAGVLRNYITDREKYMGGYVSGL